MAKKRVRSSDYVPYIINDWSKVDFALFYEREEDKKYNLTLEEYKKRCEELELMVNAYRNHFEEIIRTREKELRENILAEEVPKAVAAKEDELIKRFHKVSSQQNKAIEQKYIDKIQSQQIQIERLSLRLNTAKPNKTGKIFPSKYKNECFYCHEIINEKDPICKAKFADGIERYVHGDCCE